jgi:hypothetical protein
MVAICTVNARRVATKENSIIYIKGCRSTGRPKKR